MKIRLKLSTTQILLLSFLATIFVGGIILTLPICASNGQATNFIDALFTATTATCVTGLVTVPTFSHWSTLGHVIILALIQVGGLGVVTVIASVSVFLHKKMGLASGLLIQDAMNINTMSDLGPFLKKVVIGTFLVEGIGALCYMIVFVPEFGLQGIWFSIFNAVSAFCNAGIDIIAPDSLCKYIGNPIINFTTCTLIILGGLGYIVWLDVIGLLKDAKNQKVRFRNLTLHSKIVICATAFLILVGAILIFIFEHDNLLTLQGLSLSDKIQASIFQSVTCRTAGFVTTPQENLTTPSAIISMILMFIGGSPVGTAGGVKTVTFVVLLSSAIATIRNSDDVNLFNRRLPRESVRKSVAVVCVSLFVVVLSTLLLSVAMPDVDLLSIVYETISATATVGSSRNLTSHLNDIGKLIIIATMYLGRVGPISLAIAFNTNRENKNIIRNPEEEISVG